MKLLEFNKDATLEAANIRPSPNIFERERIFRHEQVWKDGPYAIYRYRYIKSDNPKPKWKYEAVILRIVEPHPRSADRRRVEAMSSNSEWGKWAWSLNSYEKAQKQIESVKSNRGAVIEANYYSSLDSGLENSVSNLGETPKRTQPPSEALQL